MAKKEFLGEKQNLAHLAKDVEQWLRQQGFEVQSGGGDGKFLIQARKQSTWRSLLGNNQAINVKIDGAPEKYTIDVDAGTWAKNLADSEGAGIVAAIATMYTLGIAAVWSASERTKIENGLWALKDAFCPACFRVGAAEANGEKFLRADGITLDRSGYYKGTKIFADTFKCKFCSHSWQRGEKPRNGFLCPKCFDEKALASTGKKIICCKKTSQRSEQGQPVGEQVYTNTFRCNTCSHAWNDGEHSLLVEACPGCMKSDTRTPIGEYVFSFTKTNQCSQNGHALGEQVFTNIFKCGSCSHEWNDGQRSRLLEICPYCDEPGGIDYLGHQVLRNFTRHKAKETYEEHVGEFGTTGITRKQMQFAIDFEAYIDVYQCRFCEERWNSEEKTRQLN